MRFLSKIYVWLFIVIALSTLAVFFHSAHLGTDVDKVNSLQVSINKVLNDDAITNDDAIFNLYYQNKCWTFNADEFELNSNVFSINSRINNYNRSGTRQDKIKLINKLIKINISPEIAFNYVYLGFNNKLNKIAKNIEKLPQNAKINIKNNKVNIKNEVNGIKIDKYLFYNNLIFEYQKGNKIINLNIPIIKTIPQITSGDLRKCAHKRSEFTTSIASSSSGRKFNIRKALNAIDGTRLSKSEKFSFNGVVGKRTADNGYKNAKVILDGEFVEGVGGGVCQVSSTLYNAVLLAGLDVVTSQKHSQRVGYVKAGFDAMVNYGTSDLVFKNNTEGDIYISCTYSNDKITIGIFGCDMSNVRFEREYEIVDTITAEAPEIVKDTDGEFADKVMYEDESFVVKPSRDGYTIKSYLVKYVDGQLIDKRLLRADKYIPQRGKIVYGTHKRANLLDEDINVFSLSKIE